MAPDATDIWAIGDIHGCLDKLKRLLEKMRYSAAESIVFIGDYIDRGPQSAEVIDYLIELRQANPFLQFLRGNHEDLFFDWLQRRNEFWPVPSIISYSGEVWLMNGGKETIASYEARYPNAPAFIPEHQVSFFERLQLKVETRDYIFVHAGMRSDREAPKDMLWIRDTFHQRTTELDKVVVFGHTPFPEPLVHDDKIGIDTGACYGGKLTAVRLPARTFVQV
ncbi:MAG: metallophosphoesterase [Myxococcales bacterium]|nr:metallophosphoesterase [Myxococcales bacterium]